MQMRKIAKRAMISLTVSLAMVSADLGGAAASAAQNDQRGSQRGEIRRPSRALCAIGGVVIGVAAGLLFGRSRRRGGDGFSDTAAVVGGVGSALICNAIRWRSVQREDQEEVSRKVATMTLEANPTVQTYRSPVTGQIYTITPGEITYRENNNTQYTTIADVDMPQRGYKITNLPFQVNAAVLNLRATPGSETSDRITGAFYRNDIIQALSETPDGQWVLVGYEGVGYGWVSRRYLLPVATAYAQLVFARPAPPLTAAEIAAASAPPPPPARPVRQARRGRGQRARAATPAVTSPIFVARRMTATPATRTAQVRNQQMPCRSVAVGNQQSQSDQHRGCQRAGGMIDFG
jgi:uncharacterized protein YcfJ